MIFPSQDTLHTPPSASGLVDMSFQPLLDPLWPMSPFVSLDRDHSSSYDDSVCSNWGFFSPPQTFDFSFLSRSWDMVYDEQLFPNCKCRPPSSLFYVTYLCSFSFFAFYIAQFFPPQARPPENLFS